VSLSHACERPGSGKGAWSRLTAAAAFALPRLLLTSHAVQPRGVCACVDALALKDVALAWEKLRQWQPSELLRGLSDADLFETELHGVAAPPGCTVTLFCAPFAEANAAVASGDAAKTAALLSAARASGNTASFAGMDALHDVAATLSINADDVLCVHVATPATGTTSRECQHAS